MNLFRLDTLEISPDGLLVEQIRGYIFNGLRCVRVALE